MRSTVVFSSVTTVSGAFVTWNVAALPAGSGNLVNRRFLAGWPFKKTCVDPQILFKKPRLSWMKGTVVFFLRFGFFWVPVQLKKKGPVVRLTPYVTLINNCNQDAFEISRIEGYIVPLKPFCVFWPSLWYFMFFRFWRATLFAKYFWTNDPLQNLT